MIYFSHPYSNTNKYIFFFNQIKRNLKYMYLFLLKCWCLILNHFVFLKLTCPLVIYFTYETFNLMIKLIKNICTCVKIRIAMWMQRQIESIIWKKKPPKNLMNSGTTNQISRRVLGRINLLYNFLVYLDHVATNSPESIYMYLHFSKKNLSSESDQLPLLSRLVALVSVRR